jgi:hypothetical protein
MRYNRKMPIGIDLEDAAAWEAARHGTSARKTMLKVNVVCCAARVPNPSL